ncbi:MAG: acyltransferase family protein [Abyssibacter sp.]|uniref:acyltransferase family protein n=1 Tax=Abyssibacter sp. TaxID=2320200 RepID=UPI00321A714E
MQQYKNASIAYRPEIDGLRALAVLPVILFHGGFSLVPGGFVGVDIFFVISGYLITSIILAELEQERFSIRRFYERRARRILPALCFVILACLPFAYAWMLPAELERFGDSLLAVASFSANLFFWSTQAYFGPAAELQPMLHTWSLAVEEQYYLFIPLVLMMLWSLGRHRLFLLILGGSVASLLIAEWGWRHEPKANFYLLPTRAWELLSGSLLAFAPAPQQLTGRLAAPLRQLGPYAGMILVLYGLFCFDHTTPIPSVYALAPVGGTALIVASTTAAHPVARLLSLRPLVAIGLISYSAYLWHQPLFAFARIRLLEAPGPVLAGALAALSLVLAYLSWRFVEAPFRRRTGLISRAPLIPAATSLVVLAVVGFGFSYTEGLPQRLPDETRTFIDRYEHYQSIQNGRFGQCFFGEDHEGVGELQFDAECHGQTGLRRFVLIGDSFSAHYLDGLQSLLEPGETVAQFNLSGCLPLLELPQLTPQRCRRLNPQRFDALRNGDVIIISAQWPAAMARRESIEYQALDHTLATLARRLPQATIVLVGASPQWPGELPVRLVRAERHLTLQPGGRLPNPALDAATSVNRSLQQLADNRGVRLLNPVQRLCDGKNCLIALAYSGGVEITASDYGHLTPPAARHVLAELVQSLRPPHR